LLILLLFFSPPLFSRSKEGRIYGSYLKGVFYFKQRKFKEALKEFRKVEKLDPYSSYIHLKTAFVLIKLKKLEEAEEELKKAKKINPKDLGVLTGLIFLYALSKKGEELEVEYERFLKTAYELDSDNLKIAEYLAQFYTYKKEFSKAIELYEKILKKNEKSKEDPQIYYWLGYLYEATEKREKAIQMWKKVLAIDPHHPDALNSLGYTYVEEGINLDEAERLIKKALQFSPKNGAYLDSLGWVYFKKGDYQKAEKYLKEAIIYTKDPVIYEHLGDLYKKLNDKKKGKKYYEKALEIDVSNERLKKKLEECE